MTIQTLPQPSTVSDNTFQVIREKVELLNKKYSDGEDVITTVNHVLAMLNQIQSELEYNATTNAEAGYTTAAERYRADAEFCELQLEELEIEIQDLCPE